MHNFKYSVGFFPWLLYHLVHTLVRVVTSLHVSLDLMKPSCWVLVSKAILDQLPCHVSSVHCIIRLVTCKYFRLYEIKDERHADAFWSNKSLAKEDALPLGERVAALQYKGKYSSRGRGTNEVKFGPGGSREISFFSRSFKKQRQEEEPKDDVKRRGVQSLGLRMGKQEYYSMGGNRGGRMGGGRGRGRGRGMGRGRGRGRG